MANDLIVKVGGDVTEFKHSLSEMGTSILEWVGEINPLVAGVVGLVAGVGIAAVEVAEQYEKATNILISKTGETGTALEGLKGDFEDVFKADGAHNAEEIANAIADIHDRLDLTGEPLQKTAEGFLFLATGLKEQAGPLIKSTTQAINAWGIEAENTTEIQDKLLVVAQKTGASITELTSSLASGQPILKQFGLSFDESATLLGEFQKAGVNGDAVVQALQKSIKTLVASGIEPSKEAFLGMIEGIQNAGSETKSTEASITLFGKSGAKMAEIIRSGKVDIDGLAESLANSEGAVEKMHAATETFSDKLTILWRSVSQVLEPLGSGIIEAGKAVVDLFIDLFNHTNAVGTAFDALKKFLQPVIDVFNTNIKPTLLDLAALFIGIELAIGEKLVPVLQFLWNEILVPFGGFLRDVFVVYIKAVWSALGDFIDVLKQIPGVSALFKSGQDALNAALADSKAKTDASKEATDALKKTHEDTNKTLGDSKTAHMDVIGALGAHKDNTKLLADALTLYNEAVKTSAELNKALFVPSLLDVATAEANVLIARDKATLSAMVLSDAEKQLGVLVDSNSTNNKALASAEALVTSSRDAAKDSVDKLKEAEKNLTDSKKADVEITKTLDEAEKVLTEAAKVDHIPTLISMADADIQVSLAKEGVLEATNKLKEAEKSLSDFQNQTGLKDQKTEKELVDAVKAARTDAIDAINKEKLALTDRNAVSKITQTLEADIFNATKTYAEYKKSVEIPTWVDLNTALNNVKDAKDKVRTAAEALQAATENEKKTLADETTTQQDANVVKAATKTALDNLKLAQIDLSTADNEATKDHGLNKAALDTVKLSAEDLKARLDATTQAFKALKESGTLSSGELRDAEISDLQKIQDEYKKQEIALPASAQIALAKLKQQQTDFNAEHITQWETMYNSIDKSVQNFASSAINTLITGDGSFKKEAMKMLTGIGEAVLTEFTKPATDAIAKFIAGAITDLLSGKGLGGIMDSLKGIGSAIGGIFGGIGGGSSGGIGIPGVGGAAGIDTGAGGDAASSIFGAGASSVTGIISAVGSIGSLITGIIGNFQTAHMEKLLGEMEVTTRQIANVVALNGAETIFNYTKQGWARLGDVVDYASHAHDADVEMIDALQQIRDVSLHLIGDQISRMAGNVSDVSGYINDTTMILQGWDDNAVGFIPAKLDAINSILGTDLVNVIQSSVPYVTVNVKLDSAPIAASIEQIIQRGHA